MILATIGLWHLGTVTAACLASAGHTVIGFDDAPDTIADLQKGHPPLFEPGLEELTHRGIEAGRLRFSSDYHDLAEAQLVWVTYDTPVDENDRADVEYVIQRVAAIFPHLRPEALVLISSQLPVGSTQRLAEQYHRVRPNGNVTFAYSPENLRLGSAIEAFMHPDRIVVGVRNPADRPSIAELFKPITDKIEWMSVESAEMTKHALNAFLATSVVFTNEIAALCEQVGADAREVERGLKSDSRIGRKAYLRPGAAYAGGTLARDISFLGEMGRTQGVATKLLSAVRESNTEHKQWPRGALVRALGTLQGKRIAVLGLAYKSGTDTLRQSSSVEICRWLIDQGASVTSFDPALESLPAELEKFIHLGHSVEETLRGADAVYIATECREFAAIQADDLVRWMRSPVVLDPGYFLGARLGQDIRIHYFAVGKWT